MTIDKLRIKAERLGNVSNIIEFLIDLEKAYNSIYTFDFLVETLSNDRHRRFNQDDVRFQLYKELSKQFKQNESPFELKYFEFYIEFINNWHQDKLPNLFELQGKIIIERLILPSDKLYISKVNIQSPGFWEFIGSLNPIQQIREWLKDHHERKKDNKFRSRQEEELGELTIMEKKESLLNTRIDILKKLGYSELEIRPFVSKMLLEPLNELKKHLDNGQIEGLDDE